MRMPMDNIWRRVDQLVGVTERELKMTSQFAYQLLEDIVLQAPIVRAAQVVEGSGWTYDALDRARYIVLVADGNNDFHVAVVRTVFDSLLRKAEDPAVVALLREIGRAHV